MSTPYAGANSFPSTLLCPDDGDAENASTVNVPMQGLADRTVYLNTRIADRVDVILATSTWTPGVGTSSVSIEAFGAGAGGGSGNTGSTVASTARGGGGAGGGATSATRGITVVAGTSYTCTIGAGGSGGASGSNNGANGGDTIFAVTAGATLATWRGAGFGAANTSTTVTTDIATARGGANVPHPAGGTGTSSLWSTSGNPTGWLPNIVPTPGGGGPGISVGSSPYASYIAGWASVQGFAGGAAGVVGTTSGTYQGGGPGGGGGGGPNGAGGAGGNGGNGNNAGNGTAGTAGTNAAANSGAGGGGAGSGGGGSAAGGAGAAGGNGGSGMMTIRYRGPQAVIV